MSNFELRGGKGLLVAAAAALALLLAAIAVIQAGSGVEALGVTNFDTVQIEAGSASAPSLSFTDDTDLGIYRGAANDLRIATGGSQRVQVTSSGLTVADGLTVSAGSVSLPAGAVGAGAVANISRTVQIPLYSFIDCQTDAGAAIGFDTTADTLPDYVNSATDGTGFVIRFDDTGATEDQNSEICAQFTIPPDYSAQGEFRIRALKDAHAGATEVINCAVSVNGAALETAGTVTTSASASTSYTCTPTIAALAVNDSVSFYLSITSATTMDDLVDVASVEFVYTATQ